MDWILVDKRKECSGSEIPIGYVSEISQCAENCRPISSVFSFGTNEFGYEDDSYGKRCGDSGCDCYCEMVESKDDNCEMEDHEGYNLYKFVNWVSPGK